MNRKATLAGSVEIDPNAGRRLLVDHALRQGRLSGREQFEPLRCEQLDAIQV
jgi:hypothetical protein